MCNLLQRCARGSGGYEEFVADAGTATVTMVLKLQGDASVGETPFGEEVVFTTGE